MPRIAAAAKAKGAALLVDATHDAGVRRIDVKSLDPDFLIFPTYKWVLGPYGRAFMYVARRRQNGVPLEQISASRKAVSAEDTVYFRDVAYVDGARRYDMGERDHFISLEMAAIGMEMMAGWGNEPIVARLSMLTDRLADGLANSGVQRDRQEAARAARAEPRLPQGHGAGFAEEARGGERLCRAAARPAADQPARLQRRGRRRAFRRDLQARCPLTCGTCYVVSGEVLGTAFADELGQLFLVPGYEAWNWYGIDAPPGTPDAIVDRLSAAILKVMAIPR